MSITKETLQKHLKDPAIFCCRREKGLVISAADLEDPGLFDDMQEAGLLTLDPNGLMIEQVIGRTLLQDVEALTPITREVIDKVNETEGSAAPKKEEKPSKKAENVECTSKRGDGMIRIEIGKAEKFEGLKLEVLVFSAQASAPCSAKEAAEEKTGEKKVIRQLVKKHIKIKDVKIGDRTEIKDGVITSVDRKSVV